MERRQLPSLIALPEEPYGQSEELAAVRESLNKAIVKQAKAWDVYFTEVERIAAKEPMDLTNEDIASASKFLASRLKLLRDDLALRTRVGEEYISLRQADRRAVAATHDKKAGEAAVSISQHLIAMGFVAGADGIVAAAYHHPVVEEVYALARSAADHAKDEFVNPLTVLAEHIDQVRGFLNTCAKALISVG